MCLPRSLAALRPGFIALALALLGSGGPGRAAETGCALAESSAAPSTCLGCHPHRSCHPVDLDYGPLAGRSLGALRSEAEVVRRGVLLPGGRVTCHSCHDAGSPWAHKLAFPPGSTVTGAVVPRDSSTYGPRRLPVAPMTVEEARARFPAGRALSPRPLCLACHAKD